MVLLKKTLRKIFLGTLSLSLLLPPMTPILAQAAEQSPTGALQEIQKGLNAVNEFGGAIAASQQQVQGLVNQLNLIYARNQSINQNTGEFGKIQATLAMIYTEAEGCVAKANANLKPNSKAKISPVSITTTEATCKNSQALIDSIKEQNDILDASNKKMACLRDMQNKVSEAANQAIGPFNNLTNAANEKWAAFDQVINIYKQIGEQLNEDLDGPNGYRKKLDELKKISMQLNDALNANPKGNQQIRSAGENLTSGIARKADDLLKKRVQKANQMQQFIMQRTQACMAQNSTMVCDTTGTPMAPIDCIVSHINKNAHKNPGQASINNRNKKELQQVFALQIGLLNRLNKDGKIDIKNTAAFKEYSRATFNKINQEMTAVLAKRKFTGNVSGAELAGFFNAKMNECYNMEIQSFEAGMNSEGNIYKAMVDEITNEEKDLANESKKWIEVVGEKMNAFRTAFNKVYNNDLPQFTANCTADEDPYKNTDCLRMMSATLSAGIKGTAQSIKLSDGSTYVSVEGTTQSNVPVLSLDSQGKASSSTTAMNCVGFEQCLSFLEKSRDHSRAQEKKQTLDRDNFVLEHNKTIDTVLGAVSAQFAAISQVLTKATGELTNSLAAAGVQEAIKTKQVEGEALSQDDKTKLYKVPSNMKAAMASKGAYTEMEDTAAVTAAMNTRRQALNRKAQEAFQMKSACRITKGDYQKILAGLPRDCSRVCDNDRQIRPASAIEEILRKSGPKIDKNAQLEISKKYNECIRDIRSERRTERGVGRSEIQSPSVCLPLASDPEKQAACQAQVQNQNRQLREEIQAERARIDREYSRESQVCREEAIQGLAAINNNARDDLGAKHAKILQLFGNLEEACSVRAPSSSSASETETTPRSSSEAKEACEALKSHVGSLGPSEEDEESSESEGSGFSNPAR